MFVLDNKTKKAYSWEYDRPPNETFSWVVNRTYRNSAYQFKIPRTLYQKEHVLFLYWKAYRGLFKITIGNHMEKAIYAFGDATSKSLVSNTPLGLLVDYDGEDIF